MQILLTILCLFVFSCDSDSNPSAPDIQGCTHNASCNYDPLATEDDGTCLYDEDSQYYNPNNGSCSNDSVVIPDANMYGCMDTEACNYDEVANINDASCWYQGVDNHPVCSCEDGFGADFVCFFDCGTDLNVITGEVMCPNDSYSLNTGFNLAGPDGTEIDIGVIINDNQFYTGFEIDLNTGEYIQATGWNGEPMYDNNLNPIYIPTQEAYNLYYQCSTSGCTSQQYSDLFSEHLVATDSAQVEMTDNDIWDDGELTTDNISDTNNYSICECYNNLNE